MTLPPPILLGDGPGFDILNSRAAPGDWWADGAALRGWMEAAGMGAGLGRFADADLDPVAERARALREAVREVARPGIRLGPEALAGLAPLTEALARDRRHLTLVPGPDGLRLEETRVCSLPEDLLIPIAEALARMLTHDFTQVKTCEHRDCSLIFPAPGNRRRWCAMATCGNRAKQAAHRARSRA